MVHHLGISLCSSEIATENDIVKLETETTNHLTFPKRVRSNVRVFRLYNKLGPLSIVRAEKPKLSAFFISLCKVRSETTNHV